VGCSSNRIGDRELQANPGDWHEQGADKGKAIVIDPRRNRIISLGARRNPRCYQQKIQRHGGIDLHVVGVGGAATWRSTNRAFVRRQRMLLVKLDDKPSPTASPTGHFAARKTVPLCHLDGRGTRLPSQVRRAPRRGQAQGRTVATSLAEDPTPPCDFPRTLHAKRGGDMVYVIDREGRRRRSRPPRRIEKRGIVIEDRSAQAATVRVADLAFSREPDSG
jgi:hypothetical protein